MDLPPECLGLTESQLGVLARQQVTTRLGRAAADAMVRSGRWEPLQLGVYRRLGGARLPVQAAIAATLRSGSGATLTGPAALSLLDLDGFPAFNRSVSFEVLLPPGRRVSGVSFPRRRDPDPGRAVMWRGEVRIATPVDALIESAPFAEELGVRRLRLAHDVLRWRGLLKPGRLSDRVAALAPRGPDDASLLRLLELDRSEATGDGERELGRILCRFDPPPEAQVWVTPSRRTDWWFSSVRQGFEFQGAVDHGTLTGRTADASRDTELRRQNIRLTYVSRADLEDPTTLIATVGATLAARAYELGVEAPRLRAR